MARQNKTMDDALALFASGKSPRECEKLTGYPATTISRKAKEQGIIKGSVAQLINDSVRVAIEVGAQNGAVKELIKSEVSKQLEGMAFYSNQARKAVKIGMDALKQEPTVAGMKTVLDGMKTGMIVEGLVPFYPNASVINNTAQAAVKTENNGITPEGIAAIHEALGIRGDW
jgi:hypothetical protein